MPTVSTATSDDESNEAVSEDEVHPYFASAFDIRPRMRNVMSRHTGVPMIAQASSPSSRHETGLSLPQTEKHHVQEMDVGAEEAPAPEDSTSIQPTPVIVEAMSLEQQDAQQAIDSDHAVGNIASKSTTFGFTPVQENGPYDSRAAASAILASSGTLEGADHTDGDDEDDFDDGVEGSESTERRASSRWSQRCNESKFFDSELQQRPSRQRRRNTAASDDGKAHNSRPLSDSSLATTSAASGRGAGAGPRVSTHDIAVVSHIRAGISPALTLEPHSASKPTTSSLPAGSQPNRGLAADRESGGEPQMEDLVAQKDWSQTPLGPRSSWPAELQMMILLIMRSESPLAIYWGEECILLYNDVWRPILKQKHPLSLGAPGATVWSEIWDVLGAQIAEVRRAGRGSDNKGLRLDLHREGYQEECYFDFTFSPIFVQDGSVGGILAFVQEVTKSILSQRRLKTLHQFSKQATLIQSEKGAYSMITNILHESNNPDVTFSILYQTKVVNKDYDCPLTEGFSPRTTPLPSGYMDPQKAAMDPSYSSFSPRPSTVRSSSTFSGSKKEKDGRRTPQAAILCATSFDRNLQTVEIGGEKEKVFVKGISTRHIPDSLLITPEEYEPLDESGPICDDPWAWPVQSVLADGVPRLVTLPKSTHKLARALVLPILENPSVLDSRITTVLIVGINPYQMLDDEYLDFLALLIGNIGSLMHFGRVRENERMNAQALFELNKAKISFFQNVSHELRTPLTLMLAPLEDVLTQTPEDSPLRPNLEMIQRNTRRLLKLVNTLLQFSRIEAGRSHAMFEETDLTRYTRDISANFESVARGFHLAFIVDCQPLDSLPGGVWVDQAMWSGILLNLLGNAFKHTWKGSVTVRQYPCPGPGGKPGVALEVIDTGVGIAPEHLPTLFGRFNRIESKQSRSHEGTGIGLSLVKELTEIHGGTVVVTSKVDVGSTFRLWIPAGREHHPSSQVKLDDSTDFEMGQPQSLNNKTDPSMFTEEAQQWISHKSKPGMTMSASGTDSTEEEKTDDYDDNLLLDVDPFGKGSLVETEDDFEVSKMDIDESEFSKLLIEPASDLQQFPAIEYLPPTKSSYHAENNDEVEPAGTFRLRKTTSSSAAPSHTLFPKPKVRRGFIVVVDDNNDMRMYLREILGKEFRVRCAVDGVDAMRLIKERHQEGKRIDLVLSDVAMPNMNGYELLAKLRADPQTMTTPFILLSARAGEEANVEGLDRGADDCMVKPFSARELLARVRSSIRLSDLRRELFREQRHALELKQLIYSISVRIRSGLSLPQILDTASRELFKVIRCNAIRICRFRSVDPETKQHWVRFVSEIVRTGKPKVMSHAEHLLPQGLQVSEDGIGEELQEQDTELKQTSNYQHPIYGGKNFISVALFYNRKIWGYLLASRDADMEDWSQSEKLLFEQTATQISLAIAHACLWEQKKLQQVEVEAALAANEAKSQILANTSHELRTPIGAIVGALSALEDTDYNLTGEQRDIIKIMQITSDVALSVINDLLDTAKLESGTMLLCIKDCPALLETLEQSVRIFADKAGRKEVDLVMEPFEDPYDLEHSIRSGQLTIWTDGDRLQQVIMNLIGNAVKFTSAGKVVVQCLLEPTDVAPSSSAFSIKSEGSGTNQRSRHRARPSSPSKATSFTLDVTQPLLSKSMSSTAAKSTTVTASVTMPTYSQQQAKYLSHRSIPLPPDSEVTHATIRFEVSDTGIGIDPEFLKNHIFQSFAQVDQSMTRRFGGTGLGLAISKHLVMMNGGSLGVTSEVGQGSVFYFTWPIMLVRSKEAAGSLAAVAGSGALPLSTSPSTLHPTAQPLTGPRLHPAHLSLAAEVASLMRAVVVEPIPEARHFLAWILHQQSVVTSEYDTVDKMLEDERQRTEDLCDAEGKVLATNYRPHAHFFFSTKAATADSILYAAAQLADIFRARNAARRQRRIQLCEEEREKQQDQHPSYPPAVVATMNQDLVLSIVLLIFSSPQGRSLAKDLIRKIKRLAPSTELTIRCRYILKPVKVDRVLECFHTSNGTHHSTHPTGVGVGGQKAGISLAVDQQQQQQQPPSAPQPAQEGTSGSKGGKKVDAMAASTAVAPIQADLDNLQAPYPHAHGVRFQQRQQHSKGCHKGAVTRAEFMESGDYDKDSTCNQNTPELCIATGMPYTEDVSDVCWAPRSDPQSSAQQPPPQQQQDQQLLIVQPPSPRQHQHHHHPHHSHDHHHRHSHHTPLAHSRQRARRGGQFPSSGPDSPTRGIGLSLEAGSADDSELSLSDAGTKSSVDTKSVSNYPSARPAAPGGVGGVGAVTGAVGTGAGTGIGGGGRCCTGHLDLSSDSTSTVTHRRRIWNRKAKATSAAATSATSATSTDSGPASPPTTLAGSLRGLVSVDGQAAAAAVAATAAAVEAVAETAGSSTVTKTTATIAAPSTAASSSRPARPTVGKHKRRGITVLCVEDNIINLRVVQYQLEKLGFDTKSAPDGQVAVDMIKEQIVALKQDANIPAAIMTATTTESTGEAEPGVAAGTGGGGAAGTAGDNGGAGGEAFTSKTPLMPTREPTSSQSAFLASSGSPGPRTVEAEARAKLWPTATTTTTTAPTAASIVREKAEVSGGRGIDSSGRGRVDRKGIASTILDSLVDTIPPVSYQRHGEDFMMSSDAGTDTEELIEASATACNGSPSGLPTAGGTGSGSGSGGGGVAVRVPVQVNTLSHAELAGLDSSQASVPPPPSQAKEQEQKQKQEEPSKQQVDECMRSQTTPTPLTVHGQPPPPLLSTSIPSLAEQDPLPSIMSSALSVAPNMPESLLHDRSTTAAATASAAAAIESLTTHATSASAAEQLRSLETVAQPRSGDGGQGDSKAEQGPVEPAPEKNMGRRSSSSGSHTTHHHHRHHSHSHHYNHHEPASGSGTGRIDLILMDCAMPVKSGFEAASEIRQLGQYSSYAATVPIIALTASAVQSTKEKCLAVGMNGYLSKPTKLKDLEGMLNQWVPKTGDEE
ncbi:hypothetical protein BGZ73_001397 [Actinomortierella ambigua]|nr:hypothetical protein BGZ73_001397 [Actinomortierella ambigua]